MPTSLNTAAAGQCCTHDCKQGRACPLRALRQAQRREQALARPKGHVDPVAPYRVAVMLVLLITLFIILSVYLWL
ncbi:hypothetical protein RCH06_001836 [Polaromonas sp. CG_9.5]|uniref:hypothetical protein n=1 Tax=Polaromonas sp. CG_9.5 TaxID=3071705 RepID=UPI002DFFF029|nr:hypothetical protein [Polaromonas sp. CG_9.5]